MSEHFPDRTPSIASSDPLRDSEDHEIDERFLKVKPRPLSRLTYKILSFNLLVVFILAMGVSYLGNARQNLIESKLSNLESETFLYVDLVSMLARSTTDLSEHALKDDLERINLRTGQKILLYSPDGKIISEVGELPLRRSFELIQNQDVTKIEKFLLSLSGIFSVTFHLPQLPDLDHTQEISAEEQEGNISSLKLAAWTPPKATASLKSVALSW